MHGFMRFVDPKSDIAFRKIFGNENRHESLVSFLNAVLDLPNGKRVVDATILNSYQAPRIEGLKETTLDVRARDQRGIHYIVEMQVQKKTGFEKRVIYYSAKAYSGQIEESVDYPRLNQVIFIGICDFEIFEGTDFLMRHLIMNTATMKQELGDLEFSFIELPKFTKSLEEELGNIIEQWVFFFKYAPNLEMVPARITDIGLKAAYEAAGKHLWTREELDVYDYWSMRERDERGAYEMGKMESARAIARKLKAEGVSLNVMVKTTGLSSEEIERL